MVKEKAKAQNTLLAKQQDQGEFLFKTMDDALNTTTLDSSRGIKALIISLDHKITQITKLSHNGSAIEQTMIDSYFDIFK